MRCDGMGRSDLAQQGLSLIHLHRRGTAKNAKEVACSQFQMPQSELMPVLENPKVVPGVQKDFAPQWLFYPYSVKYTHGPERSSVDARKGFHLFQLLVRFPARFRSPMRGTALAGIARKLICISLLHLQDLV